VRGTDEGHDEMEAHLEFLGVRLHLRGRGRWVFVTVLIIVATIVVLRLTGH
jgi:hypothetical protein